METYLINEPVSDPVNMIGNHATFIFFTVQQGNEEKTFYWQYKGDATTAKKIIRALLRNRYAHLGKFLRWGRRGRPRLPDSPLRQYWREQKRRLKMKRENQKIET